MVIKARSVRRWAIGATLSLWTVFVAAIAAPFLQEIAKEHGVFDSPTARVVSMIDALSAFIREPVTAWLVGGIIGGVTGFTIGVWIASKLDNTEKK